MNIMPVSAPRAGILVSLLAILTGGWLSGASGLAAPLPSAPVSLPTAVDSSVTPYQHEQAAGDSSLCAPQCILTYPPVPPGKRLVMTHVSAQLGQTADSIVLEGGAGTLFVTKPYQSAGTLSAPVTFYYNAGETPSARMFILDASAHTSLIVTLIGHLIPSS